MPFCFTYHVQLSLFPEFNSLSVMYGELSNNFISQEAPYMPGEAPSTKGAGISYKLQMQLIQSHLLCACLYLESNFDLMLDTHSFGSDSSDSSPSPMISRHNVRVDAPVSLRPLLNSTVHCSNNLPSFLQLEIPDPPVPGTPPCILLHPSATISASDFESKWLSLSVMYVMAYA